MSEIKISIDLKLEGNQAHVTNVSNCGSAKADDAKSFSRNNNEVIFDDNGKPSIMVRIPKFNLSDVIDGAPNTPHPAFIVNGVVKDAIYISKYQNIIVDGRAYSLPMQQPETNVTFDQAKQACESKGEGWHLMSNAEWAAIALWSKKNGTLPRGNNNAGRDYAYEDEKGIEYDSYRTLTGSGPASWAHDHTQHGIFDLNGNVFEWVSGLRLMNGGIQVIPDNNAALGLDQSPGSNKWEPLFSDDKILSFSETDNGVKLTTEKGNGYNGCKFGAIESDIDVPVLLKALGLFPDKENDSKNYLWADTEGERFPIRGGSWGNTSYAGVFCLDLSNARSNSSSSVGFRSAVVL